MALDAARKTRAAALHLHHVARHLSWRRKAADDGIRQSERGAWYDKKEVHVTHHRSWTMWLTRIFGTCGLLLAALAFARAEGPAFKVDATWPKPLPNNWL